MQGDYVIARAFGNVPIVRRVWSVGDSVVHICTDIRYNQLLQGKPIFPPIGFPKKDIFEYEKEILEELANNPDAWDRLKLWNSKDV